eukprot:TRINITY_DN42062_c0_g1_i1.p1 TRINITY_DN42062_c0_g1~~TRINITY_DN42062_c0_g1_i1.p1  ORF type:complete len:422 (+),score=182.32 TRINITY_DN42062_c0_g1_i1:48-1313(+)
MAIMAKKSKKVKAALEVSSDGASVDENVSIAPEPSSTKKKKVKSDKENLEITVSESMDISTVEKSSKKEKKKKSKTENSEVESETVDTSTVDVSDTLSNKEKKKLKKLSTPTLVSTNGDGPKKSATSVVRSSKQRLKADHDYIASFLAAMHIPNHKKDEEGEEFEEDEEGSETKEEKEKRIKPGGTSRAASSQELRDRLQAKLEELRGRKLGANESKRQKKMKRKLASIEKKKLADEELKQKLMTIGKNAGNLNKVINKEVESMGAKVTKPGVKTEKGVVFSKFDFKDDMAPKEVKKKLDPQAALDKIKKNKDKIKLWEDKGKTEKAGNIGTKIAWENALGKAQGEKVKDDEFLLKKSIKKNKQIKNSSKKKWDGRAEGVKAKEKAFVEKREGNMLKRKKEKKAKTMKTLVAKGRHLPGSK